MAQLLPLSPVPLYSQLKELLRTRILDGTYPGHAEIKGKFTHFALKRLILNGFSNRAHSP